MFPTCLPRPPKPSPTCSLVDQLTSQHAEELGTVQCGQPFALEVEALDAFNNRWAGRSAAGGV